MARQSRRRLIDWGLYLGVAAFGVAFGHLEAVVVVYIRQIMGIVPTPEQLDPEVLAQVPGWLIGTEQTREASTIIILASLALVAGRTGLQRLGIFLYAFGIWDVVYYISLKVMIEWPASLTTTDCLFLIPGPWYCPVWVPLLVACLMIIWGARFMEVPRKAG